MTIAAEYGPAETLHQQNGTLRSNVKKAERKLQSPHSRGSIKYNPCEHIVFLCFEKLDNLSNILKSVKEA